MYVKTKKVPRETEIHNTRKLNISHLKTLTNRSETVNILKLLSFYPVHKT